MKTAFRIAGILIVVSALGFCVQQCRIGVRSPSEIGNGFSCGPAVIAMFRGAYRAPHEVDRDLEYSACQSAGQRQSLPGIEVGFAGVVAGGVLYRIGRRERSSVGRASTSR